MLIRYRRAEDGRPVAKAVIYTAEEHGIDRSGIDPDAIRIIERLRENGHEAYIVGGAVRDLLLGRRPKDFDIATDAQPPRIKKIFRSARVIGRRFRLVHVYVGSKIFEVSTFRSIANGTVGNEFGTVDEDAYRRDFTLNALYFDPHDSTLVDYVGGFKDIASRRIEPVIPLKRIFKEDPVRMIRCIKYAVVAGFRIPLSVHLALKRDAALLTQASPARLTEEFLKILASGCSSEILEALARYGLLRSFLPETAAFISGRSTAKALFFSELSKLDSEIKRRSQDYGLAVLLAHFFKPLLESALDRFTDTPESFREALALARRFLSPLNPPRAEVEAAIFVVFKRRGLSPLLKPRREAQERRRSQQKTQAQKEIVQKMHQTASSGDSLERKGSGAVSEHATSPAKKKKRRRRPRDRSKNTDASDSSGKTSS